MITILDNSKSLSTLVNDSTNGLGQINALTCFCDEELNGIYEVELTMSATDRHFNDLSVGSLLKINLDGIRKKQIFEVYYISKVINEIVTVKAQHISYRLNKIPVSPFTATGAVATTNGLIQHIIGSYPFIMTTDITNTSSVFTLDIPRSFRECLGGYEGSVLDVFRGEYEWDNLTVKMLAHRGSDNGVRIAYGKNLTDFNQEENIENVYTSVLGYAVKDNQCVYGDVYHKIQTSNPKVKIVDFSSDFETTPTSAELTAKAQEYATNNSIEISNDNIKVSFVPLYQTEEYKNIAPLERVNLGDTVHVFFERLNVEASSRVIKTRWNCLLDKYEEIELGSVKANLNTVINSAVQSGVDSALSDLDVDTGFIEDELTELGELVTNGLGLFITRNVLIDGSERIVLHNKPDLVDSNIQYYISANGLVVSTDYGQNWNAGFNPDGSAVVNALSANIIRALQIYGSFLRFGSEDSNYIDVAPYSANNVPQGVSFDGTGGIRMRPAGQFNVQNYLNNKTHNQILLSHEETKNGVYLYNLELEYNAYANILRMEANDTANTMLFGNIKRGNTNQWGSYFTLSSYESQTNKYNSATLLNRSIEADRSANSFTLGSYMATGNSLTLNNYIYGSTDIANSIQMSAGTGGGRTIGIYNYDPGNTITNRVVLSYVDGITIEATRDDIKIVCSSGGVYIQGHKLLFSNGDVRYE